MFTVVVDDFGIKFTSRRDAEHLASALKYLYVITKVWEGKQFLGLTLNWDYTKITVDVSMPKCVEAALHKLQHPILLIPQAATHRWNRPTYEANTQYVDPEDKSESLPPEGITTVSKIVGTFPYYALALDSKTLVALSDLTETQ